MRGKLRLRPLISREGGLSPDGEIKPFKAGIERIIKRTPMPAEQVTVATLEARVRELRGDRP